MTHRKGLVMKRLVLTAFAAITLGVWVPAAAEAATHHRCGNQGSLNLNIHATNTTCSTALKIVDSSSGFAVS